ncbi:ABC transporter substrate-binding protein [Roseomonas sp. GC11]|uniref:ABC transporter substrate-binding protein n=1 Tax=Roseomonas sp. GC11 TaxID=2950546 RepID=UPI0021095521|nr:ABC transporter substrate-binding protein [Roseomonas sp. GC11]MCQ4160184.1 ABC transporter substrate-binding protein [Roseomonas sp. GC11]
MSLTLPRRALLAGTGAAAMGGALAGRSARAQARSTIRIGVLTDMSGPYRDPTGPGSVACAQQAAREFMASHPGIAVEIVAADHQNRADTGSTIARRWYDQDGVDMILDVPTSSVALAVAGVTRDKDKVFVNSGAATPDLYGSQCTPNTVHWTYDTQMISRTVGTALTKAGGDTWYFITADYTFGHNLQRDTTRFVEEAGGKVVGAARYPFPSTTDFSSFLVQAQASRAKVVGLANAGADTVNAVKQAREFGLTRRAKLATLLLAIADVHGLGLENGQGLLLTESFYWDMNARTRAFAARMMPHMPGGLPVGMIHAGCYAGTLHYLKAVADLGVAEARRSGRAVVERMKAMPTDDDAFGAGRIRPDGRKLHPAYLFEVKSPQESKAPFDYYKLVQTVAADEVFRPMSEGGCPLIRG